MLELTGHNAPQFLDTLEINLTVDHVGLPEPLKLSTTELVLNPAEKWPPYSQLLILPLVVLSYNVSPWDVTEDKSPVHGLGSERPELLLEVISVIKKPVIHTLCHNALITLNPILWLIVQKLLKLTQPVTQNAQVTPPPIKMTKLKLHHHMDSNQLMKLNKT